ncbi:hypothetical protein [Fusibacter ferrireducens]|uniref:Uncharacterized protein n=1 Tax=Fusibacter ferrireducens TaxID=2785058 RepID=A0ABS0A069_9FIRM|nr:hypothetical protein [Fusibacter ferrireducens]MBF4696092.1 hypothetical protein [Fusibacter ferrireducens]
MDRDEIKYEIGLKGKIMIELDDWKISSDPIFHKECMKTFFKGYCKHNGYDTNLIFEYIDNKIIGATTFYLEFSKHHFILFNFNTIPLLKSYYYTLMKYYLLGDINGVWDSIFKIDTRVSNVNYETDFDQKVITYNGVWSHTDKDSLVNFLTFISTQFLMNHEIAHCLNGHTKFLASSDFVEYVRDENIDKTVLMKTLEMDADAYAAGSLANYINNFNYDDLCIIFPYLTTISRSEMSTLCVFAILSTFMCSSEYVSSSNKYLTPLMRAVLSIDVLLAEFKLLSDKEFNPEVYKTLIFIAYENYSKIFDKEIVDFDRVKALMKEHKEYEEHLRKLWITSLRNKLDKFAFEELAK